MPYFTEHFGNPHSRSHAYGWEAEEAVEKARAQVATLIGADAKEIDLHLGRHRIEQPRHQGRRRVLQGPQEPHRHHRDRAQGVLDTCRELEQQGFEVTYLPVQKNGLIDLEALRAAVTDKTVVVSIMAVNNEIGVIQPLAEIGEICREKKAFFHADAAQAAGKIPLDVEAMKIDLMSISATRSTGPRASARCTCAASRACASRRRSHGGGQERGLRSGTLPTPLFVGMGEACRDRHEARWTPRPSGSPCCATAC